MTQSQANAMAAVLDCLIPGDADFPRPSQIGLHDAIEAHPRFASVAAALAGLLPADFNALPEQSRIAILSRLEAEHGSEFEALITALYSLYYVHPAVLHAVERISGYSARPPQPGGYALKAFDPAIVAVPAARARQYREADPERQ